MKFKLMVGTLAAGMAVSSFAGIPLSDKGLAEKLGVNVASAAGTESILELLADQTDIYNQLVSSGTLDKVTALQSAFKALTRDEHVAALGDLYTKLKPAVADLTPEQKDALIDLLRNLAIPLGTSDLDLLTDPNVVAAINALENALGVDVSKEDIAEFLVEVNDQAYTVLSGDADWRDHKAAVLGEIWDKALALGTTGSELLNAVIHTYYGDSKTDFVNDIVAAYAGYQSAIGADVVNGAVDALANAFLAANQPSPPPVSGNGGTTVTTPGSVTDALNSLADLKSKLASATDAEKQALIAEALQKVNAAVASVATLDVSKLVTKDGDKASVTIASSTVADLIANLAKIKAALIDAIGSADGLVIPPAVFNLGELDQSSVTSAVPSDVLAQLAEAGFTQVALSYNGLTVMLPMGAEFAKGFEFTSQTTAATEGQTHGLKAASDVYEFSVKLGGTDTEQFTQPILIKFPFNASGVDSELLSVARIEPDGTLSFQGGDVAGEFIVEPRYSLSSYVVVENKVTFNDIASVQSWAGRQIEIIAAKGAIQGKADGVFAPKDDITRAEFAKILVTALNLDHADATTDKFTDVKTGDWFAPYVAVAVEKGIINGRTATTFDPNATITRAELSTMIARALTMVKGVKEVADPAAALSVFSDAGEISPTLQAGVALAASKQIVIGDDGKFRPNDKANRAEAAVIIYRAINVKS